MPFVFTVCPSIRSYAPKLPSVSPCFGPPTLNSVSQSIGHFYYQAAWPVED